MAMACALPAYAVDWRFEPSVGASATYTDNVNQSASNPEDALILSVTPGFSLRSHGSRRVQATMNYSLTGVSRYSENNSTDLFHNLAAVGKAELIEDFLFLDGTASISQTLLSLTGSPADATTNSANRATVGVYSLSPYIQKRFGTFATGQARFSTGGVIFGDNAGSDSVSNTFTAGVNSGPRFNDLSWGLNYSLRQLDSSATGGNSTFERASATAGYALTRKFRIFGTYGQERNEYLNASGADGVFYSGGFGWAPSRRTSIEASIGERYFGRTYSLLASHKMRATNIRVSYSEDVSDISQQLTQDSGRIYWECGRRLREAPDSPHPTCNGPYTGTQVALYYSSLGFQLSDLIAAGFLDRVLANGVYVIKSFNAGVSWSRSRLGLGLSAFDTKRIFQSISGTEDHTQGVSGTVSYRLSPRTNANGSVTLTRNSTVSPITPSRQDDLATLSLGMDHRFDKDLSGALTYRYQQRSSDAPNADFNENSLTATANMRF
ncbi:MAG: TIGR03016 family PEP-CTERM system-associated outer membrane protein [Sulfuriferula multivorans]|uniref:TIGR03016 family PEP-CTERM system-associated outer membrane protein n=1 Tax=Sulfuriferula multivorans TaxID=1559896 RepID=A0A7C9NQ37_9PROT|nr:TIGR03016 family PEP-CTERM system-associated outer membrane protein [Sulfuriferula multivorans]